MFFGLKLKVIKRVGLDYFSKLKCSDFFDLIILPEFQELTNVRKRVWHE